MEEGPALIDCKPYRARIMPRACGLRHRKALTLSANKGAEGFTGYSEFFEVEKCLECAQGKRYAVDATDEQCKESGCKSKANRNGLCWPHYYQHKKRLKMSETKDKTPGAPSPQPSPLKGEGAERTCKRCKRQVPEGKRFSKKDELCGSCQTVLYLAKKRGETDPPVNTNKSRREGEGLKEESIPGTATDKPSGMIDREKLSLKTSPFSKGGQRGIITPPPPVASAAAGDVVGKLMSDLFMHLNKAKEIHGALTTIKNLTGADIHIPEINF